MKTNLYKLILLKLLLIPTILFCQSKAPLLSGKAKFSVKEGTIACDLTLSDFSEIKDYVIRLNSGLNILNIQNSDFDNYILGYSRAMVDSIQTHETNSYFFPSNDRKSKILPSSIRFQYVGKFPVLNDTLNQNVQKIDWRGNIAFNNQTLRADGTQSAWFPVLYDISKRFAFTEVRYDIEIECADCETLYVNGNTPIKGSKHRFKSEIAREPYLFLGKYNVQQTESLNLLNTDFNEHDLKIFENVNSEIIDFLERYTQLPMQDRITWVQAMPTTYNIGYFAFVSYPTFTNVGYPPYGLESFFKQDFRHTFLQLISHEFGHYYFGTLKKCNNVLENIVNEGFAEFVSLKYLTEKGLFDQAKRIVTDKLESIDDEDFQFVPYGEFKDLSDTNDRQTYAYDYLTLVLLSIEKEIGEENMKKWIQLLLQGETPLSDIEFLKYQLKEVLKTQQKSDYIVNTYLLGSNTKKNIIKILDQY